jgi:hypothetical protein
MDNCLVDAVRRQATQESPLRHVITFVITIPFIEDNSEPADRLALIGSQVLFLITVCMPHFKFWHLINICMYYTTSIFFYLSLASLFLN